MTDAPRFQAPLGVANNNFNFDFEAINGMGPGELDGLTAPPNAELAVYDQLAGVHQPINSLFDPNSDLFAPTQPTGMMNPYDPLMIQGWEFPGPLTPLDQSYTGEQQFDWSFLSAPAPGAQYFVPETGMNVFAPQQQSAAVDDGEVLDGQYLF